MDASADLVKGSGEYLEVCGVVEDGDACCGGDGGSEDGIE